jgi:hypothetical protein
MGCLQTLRRYRVTLVGKQWLPNHCTKGSSNCFEVLATRVSHAACNPLNPQWENSQHTVYCTYSLYVWHSGRCRHGEERMPCRSDFSEPTFSSSRPVAPT